MYLTLNTPQLNLNPKQEGAFGLCLGTASGLSRQIVLEQSIQTVVISPDTDPILTIPVSGVGKISQVIIDKTIYKLSESVDVENLAPNEFIYNPYSQEVTIPQYSDPIYVEIENIVDPVTVVIENYSSVNSVYIGGNNYTVMPPSTPIESLLSGQAVFNSLTNELTFIPK